MRSPRKEKRVSRGSEVLNSRKLTSNIGGDEGRGDHRREGEEASGSQQPREPRMVRRKYLRQNDTKWAGPA